MKDHEYAQTLQTLTLLAHMVGPLDLAAFIQRIGLAEAAGPILHPTLYRQAAGNLQNIKRLAQACQPFQHEVRRQLEQDT